MDNATDSSTDERDPIKARALFAGLVYTEDGEPANVVNVGGFDHYAIPDQGFVYHIEAFRIDDVVLDVLQQQMHDVQPQLIETILDMIGRRDIFTKAALDSSLENLAENVRRQYSPQWTTMLGLAGFRVIVDYHGEVLDVVMPNTVADEGDED